MLLLNIRELITTSICGKVINLHFERIKLKDGKFINVKEKIMHKRILLCLDKNQFESFDYSQPYNKAMFYMGANSGNNVFQYSLQSILSNSNNETAVDMRLLHELGISIEDKYYDEINNNFDCVVFSPANVLANFAKKIVLPRWTRNFENIKIPIYAIGLGAQSDKNFSMDYLKDIKDEACAFIKTVLKNNGFIGVRGEFSAECMKKLGFREKQDFSIIGCPSMFLTGGVKIDKKVIKQEEFIPLINGFRAWNNNEFHKYFKKYPKSIFVCQEEFYRLLYKQNELTWKEYQYLYDDENKFFNMYKENRIKLYGTFQSWYHDIKDLGINFSFGCRIHGNIVPLLAGIPAFIDAFDSRTKELAQYFDIPYGDFKPLETPDPYELYEKADYSKFNKNFKEKYEKFENFTKQCNLNIKPIKEVPRDLSIIPQINTKILENEISKRRKIAFVAHEFGLYKGHGGIASYLYNICSWLLKRMNFEVFVFTSCYDSECDLFENTRFNINLLKGSLEEQRNYVFEKLEEIQPDYIEFAEYNALGLKTVMEKRFNNKLENSAIVTNNHTATRECWEWSSLKNFAYAPDYLRFVSKDEETQIRLSDYCIAPSSFLAKYVKENYKLDNDVLVFANPYLKPLKTKEQIRKEISENINLDEFDNSFNIVLISRFERRKQQENLVKTVKSLIDEGFNIKLIMAGNATTYGDGNIDYRDYVMDIAQDYKDIYFYDFADIKAQEKFIAIADLTIMPSIFENQPVAMVETVLREIPVMASIYSGITDYTKDERLLFDPFVENDLTDKIRNFINLSNEERQNLQKVQLDNLNAFINPSRCILERINLKPVKSKDTDYKKEMELLVK